MPRQKKSTRKPDIDRWTVDEQFAKALVQTAVMIVQAIDKARAGRSSVSDATATIEEAKRPLFAQMDSLTLSMVKNVILPALDLDGQKRLVDALHSYEADLAAGKRP